MSLSTIGPAAAMAAPLLITTLRSNPTLALFGLSLQLWMGRETTKPLDSAALRTATGGTGQQTRITRGVTTLITIRSLNRAVRVGLGITHATAAFLFASSFHDDNVITGRRGADASQSKHTQSASSSDGGKGGGGFASFAGLRSQPPLQLAVESVGTFVLLAISAMYVHLSLNV